MKKIILTGGGTAGHVTPNIALIEKLRNSGWEIFYIGSKTGIEKELIFKHNIPYYSIATGKLRRYFSWQNFIDPFKIIYGIVQAFFLCRKIKPNIVFSKGGFVAFPVCFATWLNRIPVVVHESDLTVGLANKLSFPFAKKICVTFPETKKYVKYQDKVLVTGSPIRPALFSGNAENGLKLCGFTADKKVILVFGGSLGADKINTVIRALLPEILNEFQIAHVCGNGNVDERLNFPGYKQFTYLDHEFPDVMAAANMVISRAGANTIYELLALRKPHILLPLGDSSSRGDQIKNAEFCNKNGYSEVILESELTPELLLSKIDNVSQNSDKIKAKLAEFMVLDSVKEICDVIAAISSPE